MREVNKDSVAQRQQDYMKALEEAQNAAQQRQLREQEEQLRKAQGSSDAKAGQQPPSAPSTTTPDAAVGGVQAHKEAGRLEDSAKKFLATQAQAAPPASLAPTKVDAAQELVRVAAFVRQREPNLKG